MQGSNLRPCRVKVFRPSLAVLVTARFAGTGAYWRWRRWLRTAGCDGGVARPLHAADHSPPPLGDIGRGAEPSLSRHRAGVACCPQHLVRDAGLRSLGAEVGSALETRPGIVSVAPRVGAHGHRAGVVVNRRGMARLLAMQTLRDVDGAPATAEPSRIPGARSSSCFRCSRATGSPTRPSC
jgi:hypothetical protein